MNASQQNVLLPHTQNTVVSGPLIFSQANETNSQSGRVATNERAREIIGFPQGDLQKQVGRYFYVGTTQWQVTQPQGHLLFQYGTEALLTASPSLLEIMDYYRQIRASPVLRVTVSGNAAQIGQLCIIFAPSGVHKEQVLESKPAYFPYSLLKLQENSVAEINGNYVKHLRADDTSYHNMDFGYFLGYVQNRLYSPATSPQAVSVVVHVKFEHVSLQVYKAPTHKTRLQRFRNYFETLAPEEQAAFAEQVPRTKGKKEGAEGALDLGGKASTGLSRALKSVTQFARDRGATTGFTKGGVIDTIADGMETAGKIAGGISKLIPLGAMLFHSPPRPFADEMAVGDRPKTVCRLQFSDDHCCPPDPTVAQMPDLYKLMDIGTLVRLPCRTATFQWNDTHTTGTQLYTSPANPQEVALFADYLELVPSLFRGSVTYRFQVIKSIHHQGQLLIQVQSAGGATELGETQLGISQVFDIAATEQCEITVPWGYGQDFVDVYFGRFFNVTATVLCMLQTTNTTSTVEVNVWRSVGEDFQFIGGPCQSNHPSELVSFVDTIPPQDVAHTKGILQRDTDPIVQQSTGALTQNAEQVEVDPVTQTQLVGASSIVPTNKPEDSHPLYDTSAEAGAGWSKLHESNLKMSAHRPQLISVPGRPTTQVFSAPLMGSPAVRLFQAGQADLLRIIAESRAFAYVSGGVRLTWVTSAVVDTPGIIEVFVSLKNGSVRYDYFPVNRYTKHTVEIPYYQQTPAVPMQVDNQQHQREHEITQLVAVSLLPLTKTEAAKCNFTMYWFIAAADDYAAQQPVPFRNPTLKEPVYIALKVGTPPAEENAETETQQQRLDFSGGGELPAEQPEVVGNTKASFENMFGQDEPAVFKPSTPHRPYIDHLPAIQRCVEKLETPVEKEKPEQGVFPIESDRLKTLEGFKHFGQPLKHCCSRIHHTIHHADVRVAAACSKRLKTFVHCQDAAGDRWIHYHNDIQCIMYKPNPADSDFQSHAKASFAAAYFRSSDLDSIVPVPFVTTRVANPSPTRIHGLKYSKMCSYFTAVGSTLFTTRGPSLRDPRYVWGALPHTKGLLDWMTSKATTTVKSSADVFTDRVEETFTKKLDEFTKKATKSFGVVAETLALRFAAYVAQFASVRTYGQWTATFLFILSDIHMVFASTPIIKKVIDALKNVATKFLNLFWRPDEDFESQQIWDQYAFGSETGATPKTKSDQPQDWMGAVSSVFHDLATEIFGVAVSAASAVPKVLKDLGMIGNAIRGIQSLITGVKAFFVWLGLASDDVKESISAFQAYVAGEEVIKAVSEMQYQCQIPCQSLFEQVLHVTANRGIARKIASLSAGLREPTICKLREIANQYLKHTQPVSSISRGETHFEPVFVVFEGDAGVGKTLFMEKAAKSITQALGREPDNYFSGVLDADFMTGYVDQPVVVFDDLFQDPKGERVPFLTQLISSTETPIPQADIESKGCVSSARIIMATTNSAFVKPDWTVKPEAIYRRFRDSHFIFKEDKVFRVLWERNPHTSQLERKPFSTYPEFTHKQVTEHVWELYLTKWQRHLSILEEPIVALRPAPVTAMAPTLAAQVEIQNIKAEHNKKMKLRQLPVPPMPQFPMEGKVNSKRNAVAWEAVRGEELYQEGLTTHAIMFPHDTAEEKHPLRIYYGPQWCAYDMINLLSCYKLPYLSLEPASHMLQGTLSENQKKVRQLSPEQFEDLCNFYLIQGCDRAELEKLSPTLSCFYDRCQDALKYVKSCSKVFKLVGAFMAVVVSCIAIAKCANSTKATYSPRATTSARPRLQVGAMASVQHAQTKGFEDKVPVIKKYIVDFWTKGPSGPRVFVKGLLIGGKFLLTVAHAVRPGFQHGFMYNMNGKVLEVPIVVSPSTFTTTKNQGLDLDIALIYLGSAFPNTRDITNYFITSASLESLPSGPATMLMSTSTQPLVEIKTTQQFEFNKALIDGFNNNRVLRQNQFTTRVGAPDGSCGSPLITNDKTRDGRIIGILNGGTDSSTSFVPVTLELLVHLKGRINKYVENPPVPDGTSIVDRAKTKATTTFEEIISEQPHLQAPVNPVHMEIEHEPQPPVIVNLSSSYNRTAVYETPFFHLRDRCPALHHRGNITVKHPDRVGLLVVPGDQFLVDRLPLDVDGLVLDQALDTVIVKLSSEIPSATVLSEEEVVNGYCKYHGDRPYENKGFPTNTASGHTSKALGLGDKKKDFLEEGPDGTRRLNQKFRSFMSYVETLMLKGQEYHRVIALNLKDELRDKCKYESGKIRLFCIEDGVFVFLMTKYFGHFMDQYRSLPFQFWHTLGKDPVVIWNDLANYLGGRVVSADGKNWDMSLQGFHFECARRVIEHFYQNDTTRTPSELEEDAIIRQILLDHVCYSVTGYNRRQYMSTGMKSGIYATTEFNTLIQTVIIVYHSLELIFLHGNVSIGEAAREVLCHRFVSNGDDNMHSSPAFCPAELYAQQLPITYGRFGIKITSSDKTVASVVVQDIGQVSYLRRRFNFVEGVDKFFPSMEDSTLSGLVYYYKKTTAPVENLMEAFSFARQGHNTLQYYCLVFVARQYYPELEPECYSWSRLTETYNAPVHDRGLAKPPMALPELNAWRGCSAPTELAEFVLDPLLDPLTKRIWLLKYKMGDIVSAEKKEATSPSLYYLFVTTHAVAYGLPHETPCEFFKTMRVLEQAHLTLRDHYTRVLEGVDVDINMAQHLQNCYGRLMDEYSCRLGESLALLGESPDDIPYVSCFMSTVGFSDEAVRDVEEYTRYHYQYQEMHFGVTDSPDFDAWSAIWIDESCTWDDIRALGSSSKYSCELQSANEDSIGEDSDVDDIHDRIQEILSQL